MIPQETISKYEQLIKEGKITLSEVLLLIHPDTSNILLGPPPNNIGEAMIKQENY